MTSHFITTLPLAGLILAGAAMALADPVTMPFAYEQFEVSIPHFDLEDCPADLAAENTFCRATFHREEIHVFAFSPDGNSPLTGFASYPSNGLAELLN